MNVEVQCYAGYRGEETPRRLVFPEREVELEVVDQWLSPDHRYFKARGSDDALYILRHDDRRGWEITTYAPGGDL